MTHTPPTPAAYTLLERRDLPLWNATGWTYRHRTGARVLSIHGPDDNKTFGITFPTLPADHTGLAHILEHSVLCGSERFPVKEPFKELLKTSLHTFLNAFTYPDRTCYPVASRNLEDYRNLMDVYLDAVFFPRLTPAILGQEGWRHQWTRDGALEIQGVVYNEMKGVYASPDARLDEQVQRGLFPDTLYRFDYGGDPAHIPELTFEALSGFHRKHYHPANALVGFYGDDDPLERLERLDEVLSRVPAAPPAPLPALQAPWESTRRIDACYPAAEDTDEGAFCQLNWLLPGDTADPIDRQLIGLVSHLLLNTPASPLRLALLESGLGDDLLGGAMLHLRQPAFGAGLRGVEPGGADSVFALVDQSLQTLVRDGFRETLVEGALNQMEFQMREMNTSAKGLHAILTAITPWIYGGDPLEALDPAPRLRDLRRQWEHHPALFTDWIRQHLLDNPNRLQVVLEPDTRLARREREAEDHLLARHAEHYAARPDAEARARKLAADVEAFQTTPDRPEDLAKLPTLQLRDIRPLAPHPPVETDRVANTELTTTHVAGNGIVYLHLAFDFQHLPIEDLHLLPLYSRCLTELGTRTLDHLQFSEELARHTGGVSIDFQTSETYRPDGGPLAIVWLKAKALRSKIDRLTDLLASMLTAPRLGPPDRIHQLLLEERANEESRLVPSGHQIVAQRLKAGLSATERASEELDGASYLLAIREWESRPVEELQDRLRDLHRRLITRNRLRAHLGGSPADVAAARVRVDPLLRSLPAGDTAPAADWTPIAARDPEALVVSSPVNFVGMATRIQHPDALRHYSHFVARRLLNNDYLWERVRMRGGAYGCSASFSHLDGRFLFTSYRDPHLEQTLERYRASAAWLQQLSMEPDALDQAKIGTLGKMDPPERPASIVAKSFHRHLVGLTYERRLTHWEQLLDTRLHHIHTFGTALAEALDRDARICVLAGPHALDTSPLPFPARIDL